MKRIELSNLNHTWFIDIDGVIAKHNSYLDGQDVINENIIKFFKSIPINDTIIITTSRQKKHKKITETFLKNHKIKFHCVIYDLPPGERIVINDKKPKGLKTAKAINTTRDNFLPLKIVINKNI